MANSPEIIYVYGRILATRRERRAKSGLAPIPTLSGSGRFPDLSMFSLVLVPFFFNSAQTGGIVKASGFTRGICKNRRFYEIERLLKFLENRRAHPQKIAIHFV